MHAPCSKAVKCSLLAALFPGALAMGQDTGPTNLAEVEWLHGAPDCAVARLDPGYIEWQAVRYSDDTYLFRQNKCSNYEAPFVYLLVGADKSLLIDTGATVDGGAALLAAVRSLTDTPLIVAHSHGHGDHVQGDVAFLGKEDIDLVGAGAAAVQDYFGFRNWPEEPTLLELGERSIGLLPIPGHTDDDLAFFDPHTGLLVTGDSLYPGRLYVRNWAVYRASIARLLSWTQDKAITLVMGTHIEMTETPDVDYPVGTEYQPDERHLPLSIADVAKLHDALLDLEAPERSYLGDFIIWPL